MFHAPGVFCVLIAKDLLEADLPVLTFVNHYPDSLFKFTRFTTLPGDRLVFWDYGFLGGFKPSFWWISFFIRNSLAVLICSDVGRCWIFAICACKVGLASGSETRTTASPMTACSLITYCLASSSVQLLRRNFAITASVDTLSHYGPKTSAISCCSNFFSERKVFRAFDL